MPRIEAIIRTVEARIRPVLMTTITTMAGLTPMMLGISLDFANGGYSIDSPTALWWKQLATAVVFGLGVATVLTLMLTPAMLALRVWIEKGAYRGALGAALAVCQRRQCRAARPGVAQKAGARARYRIDLGYGPACAAPCHCCARPGIGTRTALARGGIAARRVRWPRVLRSRARQTRSRLAPSRPAPRHE